MKLLGVVLLMLGLAVNAAAQKVFEKDTLKTSGGPVVITCVGHGSLCLEWKDQIIHIDPFGRVADYSKLPKADLILITHQHGDHLDPQAIGKITKEDTRIVCPEICRELVTNPFVMKNGDTLNISGIHILAVPAYNIQHKRDSGEPFHVKGAGNGYVLIFKDKKIYIAGDTEDIPEMADLKNIDIAFLPMNLPYTMSPEMVASAVKMFYPKIVYPYHFGDTDTGKLVKLLKNEDVEVRVRNF